MGWTDVGAALITGASSGIGTTFARKLASQGFNLILVARRRERLEVLSNELSKQHGIKVDIIKADLSELEDIEKVSVNIKDRDDVEILINNAGFGTRGYFDLIPLEPQKDMIFVHDIAPVYLCRATLPKMIKKGRGVIINLSSIGAIVNLPQNAVYNASKAFLRVFSETLFSEVEDAGIKIQCLCPGFTRTEFHEVGDFEGFNMALIPEKTWMSSEEVVNFSLGAINGEEVTVIPGEHNSSLVKLWLDPKSGKRTRKNMIKVFKISRDAIK